MRAVPTRTGLVAGGFGFIDVGALENTGSGYPCFARKGRVFPDYAVASLPIHPESLEVAGVDLDDAGAAFAGCFQIVFVKDFHHSVESL